MIGYLGCIVLFMGVYYSNTWRSQDFPFLSQLLFNTTSTSDAYVTYNTSAILNAHNEIDTDALREAGLPWMTGTYLCYLITSNMGLTATIVHMLLWNYDDIKAGWAWVSMDTVRKMWKPETWEGFLGKGETVEERMRRAEAYPALDPHYRLMLKYSDSPP
ncbi:OPT superfamily oligopeptide transporter [Neofusicoccum parvum]|uniref:OPT superfamily oligopeptide transporter n=1 Tax=Neofusicoccum parvum TaxID=310453 RepID=A0ACB5RR00_9PEZI|nr:OPT superfamily oligopeptide transporter [Neofusicoccum parvum]GME45889.1 OPT superfamily oligopeptide transporter [Neofusicoccum parvum]